MGRLVTESGMSQEASTEEAKAWKASASLIWSVKPTWYHHHYRKRERTSVIIILFFLTASLIIIIITCWLVMSRYTWMVELYTVSLVTFNQNIKINISN